MKIYHQSVFDQWQLEDKSVQSVITSPPYFGLRNYDIPDIVIGDWSGQYGLEDTMELFIEHTLLWCREVWRVLKPDGLFFLNMGDTYVGGGGKGREQGTLRQDNKSTGKEPDNPGKSKLRGTMGKCKLLIPHRIAIALIDAGWTLRNDIIWYKPNPMPESCQDRFSKKFEYIFMFSKQKKYYFDLDAVKERTIWKDDRIRDRDSTKLNNTPGRTRMAGLKKNDYDYKNPGDVWKIATQPSTHSHYAMWPEKLVERMVKCSTRPGDAVLDPFCGSGTTLMVAEQLNRKGMGIDLGYKDIQDDRLKEVQKSLLEV